MNTRTLPSYVEAKIYSNSSEKISSVGRPVYSIEIVRHLRSLFLQPNKQYTLLHFVTLCDFFHNVDSLAMMRRINWKFQSLDVVQGQLRVELRQPFSFHRRTSPSFKIYRLLLIVLLFLSRQKRCFGFLWNVFPATLLPNRKCVILTQAKFIIIWIIFVDNSKPSLESFS